MHDLTASLAHHVIASMRSIAVLILSASLSLTSVSAQVSGNTSGSAALEGLNAVERGDYEFKLRERDTLRDEIKKDQAHYDRLLKARQGWAELAAAAEFKGTGVSQSEIDRRRAEARAIDVKMQDLRGRMEDKERRLEQLDDEVASYEEQIAADAGAETARADADSSELTGAQDTQDESQTEPASESALRAFGIRAINGLWREETSKEVVAILQQDPGVPDQRGLQLIGETITWEGVYNANPSNGEPSVVFTYKPEAQEMNRRLPDWVREEVEGKLEWRIELSEKCCPYALEGHFYPGDVMFPDKGRDVTAVSIAGKGTGRVLRFLDATTPQYIAVPQSAVSFLPLWGEYALRSGPDSPRERAGLIEEQPVHIRAVLNSAAATKAGAGDTLTATVFNETAGTSETVILHREPGSQSGQVVSYRTKTPIVLADSDSDIPLRDPGVFTSQWLVEAFGGAQGQRLGLRAKKGDVISVAAGGAESRFDLYASPVALRRDDLLRELEAMEAVLTADLASRNTPTEVRSRRFDQRQMARNARTILGNIARAFPDESGYRDEIELLVLHHYLRGHQLIAMPADRSVTSEEAFRRLEGVGKVPNELYLTGSPAGAYFKDVEWVFAGEQLLLDEMLAFNRQKLRDIMESFFKHTADASYDAVLSMSSPVPFLRISPFLPYDFLAGLVLGTDTRGRPLPDGQVSSMIVQHLFGIASNAAEGHIRAMRPGEPRYNDTRAAYRTRLQDRLTSRSGAELRVKKNIAKLRAIRAEVFIPEVNKSLPQDRPARAELAVQRVLVDPVRDPPIPPADETAAQVCGVASKANESTAFGAPIKVITADDGPGQILGDCNAMGPLSWSLRADFGQTVNGVLLRLLFHFLGVDMSQQNTAMDGIGTGMTAWVMQVLGYEVRFMEKLRPDPSDLADAIDAGWRVGVVVEHNGNLHRLQVTGVTKDGNGDPIAVQYRETATESGRAQIHEMSAEDFFALMTNDPDHRQPMLHRPPKEGFSTEVKRMITHLANADLLTIDMSQRWRVNRLGEPEPTATSRTRTGRTDRTPNSPNNEHFRRYGKARDWVEQALNRLGRNATDEQSSAAAERLQELLRYAESANQRDEPHLNKLIRMVAAYEEVGLQVPRDLVYKEFERFGPGFAPAKIDEYINHARHAIRSQRMEEFINPPPPETYDIYDNKERLQRLFEDGEPFELGKGVVTNENANHSFLIGQTLGARTPGGGGVVVMPVAGTYRQILPSQNAISHIRANYRVRQYFENNDAFWGPRLNSNREKNPDAHLVLRPNGDGGPLVMQGFHHRMAALMAISEMTGRPLFGENGLIPKDRVWIINKQDGNKRDPRTFDTVAIARERSTGEDLNRVLKDAGLAEKVQRFEESFGPDIPGGE